MTDRRAAGVVLILLTAYALNPATGSWARSVVASARQMYRHRNSLRDTRAQSLLGEPWRLIDEVRRSTPPDARILIPEGKGADPLSNRIWCSYYLHPRRLVRPSEITGDGRPVVDFVLVYRGHNLERLGVPADSIAGTESRLVDLRAP
ncbi:MAG: hypothetical protein SGI90_09470 [Candidatus Eisenbacteria bacterium]|nr:hypothetical protein [Candidatus Eisenbacteria bacterium]